MTLSEMLKEYREKEHISQRELARRCQLSNSLISILEMGINPQTKRKVSPDLETYSRIAKGMGISLQTLFELLGNDAFVTLNAE
ncbi:MAG: helix-turn-helix transcriptional regulator, partial [Oscillospiraceae bacterium]|nr:helix-turn-helix transcriptional regulator [Oscillospiraceae bacterium]